MLKENSSKKPKYFENDQRRKSSKNSKSREKHKRKSISKEAERPQKYQNIRITSPEMDKSKNGNITATNLGISHIFTTPVNDKNKQSNTYLAAFETDKGRNKNEKLSKIINIDVKTSKRKHHTRCKSGFTKLSKRNNLNKVMHKNNVDGKHSSLTKPAFEVKNKPPTSFETRAPLESAKTSSIPTPTSGLKRSDHKNQNKIDKIIRENLKNNKDKQIEKELELLEVRERMILK